jgi:hypothetical protein
LDQSPFFLLKKPISLSFRLFSVAIALLSTIFDLEEHRSEITTVVDFGNVKAWLEMGLSVEHGFGQAFQQISGRPISFVIRKNDGLL